MVGAVNVSSWARVIGNSGDCGELAGSTLSMDIQSHICFQLLLATKNTSVGQIMPVEDQSASPVSLHSCCDLTHFPSFHANADGFNSASPGQNKSLASGSCPHCWLPSHAPG